MFSLVLPPGSRILLSFDYIFLFYFQYAIMMNMSVREKASSAIIQDSAHAKKDIFKKPEARNVSVVILL